MKTLLSILSLLSLVCASALHATGDAPVKFAFLAPDGLTPINSAVYNGIRDAFKEFQARYGRKFEIEYVSAGRSQQTQTRQLGGAYIGNFQGAVVFPVSDSAELGSKISELSGKGFPTALVGVDIPKSGRLCFVGDDSQEFEKAVSGLIAKLSKGKIFEMFCYLKNDAGMVDIDVGDASKIKPLLGFGLSYQQFANIVKPHRVKIVAVDYYSVYASMFSVEIMRRDDYGELFFSPYLFADMQPVKRDPDRIFSICLGAVPQLERYLSDGSLSACVYGDYYGWGYFAARALAEKSLDGAKPAVLVRLLKPIVATPETVHSFSADWRKWMK